MAMDKTREIACSKKEEAIAAFKLEGEAFYCELYGNGHINDTFLVKCKNGDSEKKYILQRMNHEVFKKPDELIANISGVTRHLCKKILERGGDVSRETLNLIETKAGEIYFKDSIGSYWRVYDFIDDATCFDIPENPEQFYQSGMAFGTFQNLLADYPAQTLHETIVNFHNTETRYQTFLQAVKEDKMGRAKEVKAEIDFVMAHESDTRVCNALIKAGELPIRVTHNDTKLNNVMLDNKTNKGLCVLDLDTVMPGLNMNDFGDSIRFGASTATEDEKDLSKVSMSLEYYEAYTKGFLDACGKALTKKEVAMLPFGAKIMTFECGMRFLTDYLQGDVYFRIHRPEHNLDRCRTQFKLVADMENKWDEMGEIVKKHS